VGSDHYAHFVDRQSTKLDRTRQLERFRRRLRWWATTVLLATVLFTVLLVVGELT
jgi:hypothetical protein